MTHDIVQQGLEFIDPWIAQRVYDNDLPGAAYTILDRGEHVHTGTFGFADVAGQIPLSAEHTFKMASQTKTLTAAAVLVLESCGVVSLDDGITKYIPELGDAADLRWQQVTNRQLLSHGAGISRDGLRSDFWNHTADFPSETALLAQAIADPLVLDPGTQMKYSNVGYGLLGIAIQNITGMSYGAYIRQHVLEVTGTSSAGFDNETAVQTSALGYGRPGMGGAALVRGRQPLAQPSLRAYSAAAGLTATTQDTARLFDRILFDRGRESVLPAAARNLMQTPVWDVKHSPQIEYALGLDIGRVDGRRMWGHGGGYAGFMSKTLVDIANEVVVSCAVNATDGNALSMALGAMEALCFYRNNATDMVTRTDTRRFSVKLEGLFADIQVVAADNKVVVVDPHSWRPFSDPDNLEVIDKDTLQLTGANGFDSDGERIIYTGDDSSVTAYGRTAKVVHSFRGKS